MPTDSEIQRRRNAALSAINKTFGTAEGEYSVSLFVSHHVNELGPDYWQEHCGTTEPDPKQVLGLLTLRSHWGDEDDDGIDNFDFSLPGDVTDYVISVNFDDDGEIAEITMES